MNTCYLCHREFIYKRNTGGTQYECNSCSTNRRRFKLKSQIIEYLGGKCVDCGYSECMGALHCHHVDPEEKEFTISSKHCLSWDKIRTELDKCVLLCGNCHAKRHHNCVELGCNCLDAEQLIEREKLLKNRIVERTIAKEKTTKILSDIIHGTRAGYLKEYRRSLEICAECRRANNEYGRLLKQRKQ